MDGPVEIERRIGEQLWGGKEKPQENLKAVETKIKEVDEKLTASVNLEECAPKPFWPLEINEDYEIVHPTSKPPHKRSNVSIVFIGLLFDKNKIIICFLEKYSGVIEACYNQSSGLQQIDLGQNVR